MMTIEFVRKLEVVHKQVGGCLISYNLQLVCVRKLDEATLITLNDESLINERLSYLGLELLRVGQKNNVH